MLKKIATQNYKNLFLEDGLELDNLNILVGPNGSGKSNFIAMIQFFKTLFGPQYVKQDVTAFDQATHNLGGNKILDNSLPFPSFVSFEVDYDSQVGQLELITLEFLYRFTILVKGDSQPILIKNETLYLLEDGRRTSVFSRDGNTVKTLKKVSKNMSTDWDEEFSFEPKTSEDIYPANRLAMPELRAFANRISDRLLRNKSDAFAYTDSFRFFTSVVIYNANSMDLHQIRTHEPKIGELDFVLSESGDNLALVLDNLIQENLDFEETLNQAMQAILPDTRRVRPIRAGRLSLTIEWHITGMKTPFYLDEMSDGTVRMLCWATVLLHPNPPRLLVIEEPELGIHVAWLPILADWIKQAAQKTQVIISTHSPDLLDQFSDCVENVYVFHPRPQDKSHFTVKRLAPQDVESWFAEGWQLGDLYRVGDPSVGGWPW